VSNLTKELKQYDSWKTYTSTMTADPGFYDAMKKSVEAANERHVLWLSDSLFLYGPGQTYSWDSKKENPVSWKVKWKRRLCRHRYYYGESACRKCRAVNYTRGLDMKKEEIHAMPLFEVAAVKMGVRSIEKNETRHDELLIAPEAIVAVDAEQAKSAFAIKHADVLKATPTQELLLLVRPFSVR